MADAKVELGSFPPVSKAEWRQVVEQDLKGAPFEKRLVTRTHEGIHIQPLYTAEDSETRGDQAGFPGFAPFVRGDRAAGAVLHGWRACTEHRAAELDFAAGAIGQDLRNGVDAVWLCLDRATRRGLEAVDATSEGDVGRDGLALATSTELGRLLADVDLTATHVYLEAGGATPSAAGALAAVASASGVDASLLRGGLAYDPIGTLARDGELPGGVARAMALAGDLVRWAQGAAPSLRTLMVSGTPYHDAGATAAVELGLTLATGVEYLRALTERGVPLDTVVGQTFLSFSVGRDLFMEIAKLRAARLLWTKIITVCGGSPSLAAVPLHARTSAWTMTRRDPWVNMLRTTTQTFAGAVGGADVITVAPFDAAIGPPDGLARRYSRNLHTVLREEAHIHQVVDPAGGSWYVESLTRQLAEAAWVTLQFVESRGGMLSALTDGVVASILDEASQRRRAGLAKRKDPITGVSEFPQRDEEPLTREAPDLDGLWERRQAAVREAADEDVTTAAVERIASLAGASTAPTGELVAAAERACASGATLAAVTKALYVDTEATSCAPLVAWRAAEPFEALRDATDDFARSAGRRPRLFLANMGPIPQHKARAEFSANLFAVAGMDVLANDGFPDASAAAAAFREAGGDVAVICSTDATYPELVPPVAQALKAAGASRVYVAGRPGEHEADYRSAGVDDFIFLGCDVQVVLRDVLSTLGVIR